MNNHLLTVSFAASIALVASGCGGPGVNTVTGDRTNTDIPVANSNLSPTISPAPASPTIETAEPDKYSATLQLKAEAVGGGNVAIPTLTADIARDGGKRRVEFLLPNNERVIYLNLGEMRYLVMPSRRQYAELDANSVGFELPRLMMPDQIVEYLKGRNDYQRIGEENFKGRAVVKYRTAGTTETNTNVGRVRAESFTYVDKETGLPLRAELHSRASGNVGGVEGVHAVVEMQNVKTDVSAELFEVPEGYDRITSEQVRNQINTIGRIAGAIAGTLMAEMSQPSSTPSPLSDIPTSNR